MIDGLPGRELVRQRPPGTTAVQDEEHGVEQFAPQVCRRAATGLGRRHQRVEDDPLVVGQIGRGGAAGQDTTSDEKLLPWVHPPSLPTPSKLVERCLRSSQNTSGAFHDRY